MPKNNTTIPNQSNINTIVSAIVENLSASNTILTAVFASIKKIAEAKTVDVKLGDVKHVESIVISYKSIMNNIITALCQDDNGNSRDLHALLGAVVDPDKSTNNKTVMKYKTVDAALQLPKIITGMFDLFDKFGEGGFNFKSFINFKINIFKLKLMINGLFSDLLNALSGLNPTEEMNKIIDCLVKQPDVVESITDTVQTSEYEKIDNSITITKQGRLGVLDVFAKTFEVLNMLNSFKTPNFLILQVKLLRMKLALKMVLNDLIDWCKNNINDDVLSRLKTLENALLGTQNAKNQREGGVQGVIQAVQSIFVLANRINLGIVKIVAIRIALAGLKSIINALIGMSDDFEVLGSKEQDNLITGTKKYFEKLADIFKQIAIIGLLAVPVALGSVLASGAVIAVALLIVTINKFLVGKTIGDTSVLDRLVDITKQLRNISANLIITGLLVIHATGAMLVALLFVGLLGLFVGALYFLTELISIVSKEVIDNLDNVVKMIASLLIVGVAILLFALATPIIVWALEGNVLPFVLFLAGAIALLFVVSFIARFMAKFAQDNMVQTSLSLIIIMGALIVAGLVILFAAKVGEQLRDGDAWINIALMIGGMITVSAVAVGLGIALSFASPYIGWAIGGLGPLVALLGLMLVTGLTIVGLAKLKFDFGKYTPGKDYAAGDVGTGTGIVGNVGMIMGFIKYLVSKLADFDRKDIKKMRQSKRLMKQVKKTVKQIVKIADQLNYLQDIKLDKEAILGNVEALFTFIKDLDTKIQDFMKPEGLKESDGTVKTAVTNLFKKAVSGIVKRKQMQAANKVLNKVDKVVTRLNDIGGALVSIGELKMDDAFKSSITNNIEAIFAFINELDTKIATFMVADINPEDVVDAQKMTKREWRKANKKLSKVEATIGTIQGITDALNSIKELKLDDKTQDTITTNIKIAFNSVESIAGIITGKADAINIDEDKIEKLTPLVDYLNALNDGFNNIANVDPTKVEKNINNYIKYIDKVNTMQVEKVQKTAQLFEKMHEFSTDIKGDFDKLAEALSEKLLPVLEDLKEVMGVLPEKIDTGFQNTSASIAATNAAPTTENVTAQLNRENPNLTQQEVDELVKSRINERAQADANSMSAKMDELISLLRGFNGDNVVVRTI